MVLEGKLNYRSPLKPKGITNEILAFAGIEWVQTSNESKIWKIIRFLSFFVQLWWPFGRIYWKKGISQKLEQQKWS